MSRFKFQNPIVWATIGVLILAVGAFLARINVPRAPQLESIAPPPADGANSGPVSSAEAENTVSTIARTPIEQVENTPEKPHSTVNPGPAPSARKEVWQLRGIEEILPEWKESNSLVGEMMLEFFKAIPDELWVSNKIQCGPDDYVLKRNISGKGRHYTILFRAEHPEFFVELDRLRALEALPEYIMHSIEQTRLAEELLKRLERDQ